MFYRKELLTYKCGLHRLPLDAPRTPSIRGSRGATLPQSFRNSRITLPEFSWLPRQPMVLFSWNPVSTRSCAVPHPLGWGWGGHLHSCTMGLSHETSVRFPLPPMSELPFQLFRKSFRIFNFFCILSRRNTIFWKYVQAPTEQSCNNPAGDREHAQTHFPATKNRSRPHTCSKQEACSEFSHVSTATKDEPDLQE